MDLQNQTQTLFIRSEHSNKIIYKFTKDKQALITYDDIPNWYSNNKYIYYGYRIPKSSIKSLTLSIFKIHNETFNIWTHIIGFFIFVYLYCNFTIQNINEPLSIIPICIYLFGTMVCFIGSVVMHTYYPHSEHTCNILCKLDYSGIFTLIFTGYLCFIHYEFFCYPTLQIIYNIILSIVGICILFLICNRNKLLRSLSFLSFGLSSFVPIIHKKIFLKDSSEALIKKSGEVLIYILSTLIVCIIGIIFYILRVPERIHRDFFNIVLSSHSLFHICTIIAAYIYYTAMVELYEYYNKYDCDV